MAKGVSMDKTKFVRDPQLDSEGFTQITNPLAEATGASSPWSLLDQDHLDRIHQIWVTSRLEHREQLAQWYDEAMTGAKL